MDIRANWFALSHLKGCCLGACAGWLRFDHSASQCRGPDVNFDRLAATIQAGMKPAGWVMEHGYFQLESGLSDFVFSFFPPQANQMETKQLDELLALTHTSMSS